MQVNAFVIAGSDAIQDCYDGTGLSGMQNLQLCKWGVLTFICKI